MDIYLNIPENPSLSELKLIPGVKDVGSDLRPIEICNRTMMIRKSEIRNLYLYEPEYHRRMFTSLYLVLLQVL